MAELKRRSFLSALGGAEVAGPKAAKATLADLRVGGVIRGESPALAVTRTPDIERVYGAEKDLKQLLAKSPARKDAELKRLHVDSLTPDAFGLVSVNLQTKIQMTRRELYAQRERNEEFTLRGFIAGYWNW